MTFAARRGVSTRPPTPPESRYTSSTQRHRERGSDARRQPLRSSPSGTDGGESRTTFGFGGTGPPDVSDGAPGDSGEGEQTRHQCLPAPPWRRVRLAIGHGVVARKEAGQAH